MKTMPNFMRALIAAVLITLTWTPHANAANWQIPIVGTQQEDSPGQALAVGADSAQVLMGFDRELRGVDYAGETLWTLELSSSDDRTVINSAQARPGGFFISGEDYRDSSPQTVRQRWVAFVESNGRLRWRQSINGSFSGTANFANNNNQGPVWLSNFRSMSSYTEAGTYSELALAQLGFQSLGAVSNLGSDIVALGSISFGDYVITRVAQSGERRWLRSLKALNIQFGLRLLNVGGTLILPFQNQSGEFRIVGINADSGVIVWQSGVLGTAGVQEIGSDITANADDVYFYLGGVTAGSRMFRMQAATGNILAERQFSVPVLPKFANSDGVFTVDLTTNQSFRLLRQSDLSTAWAAPVSPVTELVRGSLFRTFDGKLLSARADSARIQHQLQTYSELTGQIQQSARKTFPRLLPPRLIGTPQSVFALDYAAPRPAAITRVRAHSKTTGALQLNFLPPLGFLPDEAASSGDRLVLLARTASTKETIIRLITLLGAAGGVVLDREYLRNGVYQVAITANASNIYLLLQNPSAGSNSILLVLDASAGSIRSEIDLGAFAGRRVYPIGDDVVVRENGVSLRKFSATGELLWTSSLPSLNLDGEQFSYDAVRQRLIWAARLPNVVNGFPGTLVVTLDALSGQTVAQRTFNLGLVNRPLGLKVLSDGALIYRHRSQSNEIFLASSLFRLNGVTLATEFELPISSANASWISPFTFEERGAELWVSGVRRFGFDLYASSQAEASATLRFNKMTGEAIGEYWWTYARPLLALEHRSFAAPIPEDHQNELREAELLRGQRILWRNEEFSNELIDLSIAAQTSIRAFGTDTTLTLLVRNSGSAIARNVRIRSHNENGAIKLTRIACASAFTPLVCADTADAEDLVLTNLPPQASVEVLVKAQVIASRAETGVDFNAFTVVAIPDRTQLERNGIDNALTVSMFSGPFQNGFE
jgi:hypothetical protein